MPLKINSQTISAFADEKCGYSADVQSDLKTLTGTYSSIGSLSFGATNIDRLKRDIQHHITLGLSASSRLLSDRVASALDVASILALERFAVLHFASVQRAFLRGFESVLSSIEEVPIEKRETGAGASAKARRLSTDAKRVLAIGATIDLPYMMTVSPASQLGQYFREFAEMLSSLLSTIQVTWTSRERIGHCIEVAMQEYVAWSSSSVEAAIVVRSFLNYDQQQSQHNIVLDNVGGLSVALSNWLKVEDRIDRRKDKWQAYRKTLLELPDDKSTMFDETFGVRKVFVQPTALYKVAGLKRDAPAPISDVAGLLGTLISDRTESEDLILLCGGPGSGKSTLCRVLASELASNSAIHPVFLRLRRLQESQEIAGFIEAHLQQEGLIDKLADLSAVPNLVIILDGFDELVMASRSKLREFFNALKDDLASGPLKHAKAIVSGRDTLFPNGAGLPIGAHVVSLVPFDRPRIAAWGDKWRSLHPGEEAKSFHPESLVPGDKRRGHKASPLEHLVSWPLTLHLVARAHTSGSIDLAPGNAAEFEKAVLYRSIVADTALRQENQASGRGRLDSSQMRRFVQAIAWEMYSTGREALDVQEGLPILKSILPEATDVDLAELADVTIVNQPELTKGEETGFEFVHKSFSEYFAAEQIATGIERACFKTKQWGADKETWGISTHDSTRLFSSLFAMRLLTAEVQEMLEPMLGDFSAFLAEKGGAVSKIDLQEWLRNLERKLERVEGLLIDFARGDLLDVVSGVARESRTPVNPLEAFANYTSGLLFVANALTVRIATIDPPSSRPVRLPASTLIRLIHIVQGGEIQIDTSYAERGFRAIDVRKENGEAVDLFFPPLAPALLSGVKGFDIPLSHAISAMQSEIAAAQLENMLLSLVFEASNSRSEAFAHRRHLSFDYRMRHDRGRIDYLQRIVDRSVSTHAREELQYNFEREFFGYFEELRTTGRDNLSPRRLEEALSLLRDLAYRSDVEGLPYPEIYRRAEYLLRELSDAPPRQLRRPSKPR